VAVLITFGGGSPITGIWLSGQVRTTLSDKRGIGHAVLDRFHLPITAFYVQAD